MPKTPRTSVSTYIDTVPDLVRVVTHTLDYGADFPEASRLLGRIELSWEPLGAFRLMFDGDSIDTAECLAHTLLAAVDAAREAFSRGPGSDQIVGVPVACAVSAVLDPST